MDIYILNLEEIKNIPHEYFETNIPKRLEYSLKFKNKDDQNRSLLAGYLIDSIGKIKEKNIIYNEYKKPFDKENMVFFNISHSKDYVCFVKNCSLIGVDIEYIDENKIKLSKKVCTNEELIYINNSSERFFEIWTKKESIMKCDGRGFSLPFKDIKINIETGNAVVNNKKFYVKSIKFKGYFISVAAINKIENLNIIEVKI